MTFAKQIESCNHHLNQYMKQFAYLKKIPCAPLLLISFLYHQPQADIDLLSISIVCLF